VKLVNRVSVFFLAALAAVLVAYSGAFYAFVRARLVQQFERELHGALNSLVAAVEVEPEEVKWQPLEHTIALGAVEGPDQVQWAVIGDGSRLVEKSRNATPELIAQAKRIASRASGGADSGPIVAGGDWHIVYQHLVAPAPEYSERELDEFDEIAVVVAHSAAPLDANLHRLLLLVCVLPVGTWLAAAAAGHWFCRRALQPVLDMAQQARSMTASNFRSRLPVIETRDELADLAVAFNTLLDDQHRAFEQQRRFTGDAAHELRTPLTVLLGQIDVALRRTRSPQEYAATLRLLRDQTSQLQTIVESLLFLARAEEDASLPDSETFCLAQWLPDYMRRWKEHPRSADIRLRVDPIGGSQINASPALLGRLIDNLIENALKYSPPGTSVEVIMTSHDAEVLVEVRDHGRGIAAEDMAAIFNPFFRSRAARDAGIAGTGLGLAIAARIAAACGGRLDCTSEVDRGSCFTLRLPTV
jgi:signal transduction histidine kinase